MRSYRVTHRTSYEYESLVLHAHHLARLRPRSSATQRVQSTEIHVDPDPTTMRRLSDYFGNEGDRIEVLSTHDLLTVTATSHVHVFPNPFAAPQPDPSPAWETVRDQLASDLTLIHEREFAFDSPLVRAHPALGTYAATAFAPGRPIIEALLALNHQVNQDFTYDPVATDVSTPLAQVLRERRGVCQDFAHVLVGCLRTIGLAARYVSGYLETMPPKGQPRLIGADASHAWASAFIPGRGWLDLDPTNDQVPSERHVVVAWGRDFSDVSPFKGVVLGGGAHRLTVGVDVEPLTPTKPAAAAPRNGA